MNLNESVQLCNNKGIDPPTVKNVRRFGTKTKVEKLNEENTIKEIARIASGDINDISIEHAKQLRKVV